MSITELPHNHGNVNELISIQEQLDKIEHFQLVSEIFRQLSDTTRIRIFWLLCHCEECVVNLSYLMDMSSPAISHHLRPLKSSGLVVSRREGKEVYYRAADTAQSRLLHEMIEQVMEITCMNLKKDKPEEITAKKIDREKYPSRYQPEQIEIIREIHEQLLSRMDQRYTIEALARQYLINQTTLKEVFKSVYGTSIAAHMKEHRMEQAARMLRETNLSVSEIARRVGYDSQSRFASAFKESFGKLPKDYRKNEQ